MAAVKIWDHGRLDGTDLITGEEIGYAKRYRSNAIAKTIILQALKILKSQSMKFIFD